MAGYLAADVSSGMAADLLEASAGVEDLGEVLGTAETVGLAQTSICMVKMMLLSLDEILARLGREGLAGGVVTDDGLSLGGGGGWVRREFDETGNSVTELSR